MERGSGEDRSGRSPIGRVVFASTAGTALEFYDFLLYGTAAALVFPTVFFPTSSPLAGTLAAFATFAAGFFARPLGSLVMGNYGDKVGRVRVLVVTLVLMGTASTLIGLVPGYASIGVWAPAILVALRLLQGFGAGAEYAGSALLTSEHSVGDIARRRGFYAAFTGAGTSLGLFVSSGLLALFATLPEEQFLAWGWRVPFLLSPLLLGVGLYLRLRVAETPVFEQVKESRAEARVPLAEALTTSRGKIVLALLASIGPFIFGYTAPFFTPSYATEQVGVSSGVILTCVLVSSALGFFTAPAFGALSDRVGRRPVYMGLAAFGVLIAFPFFWLVDTGVPFLIFLAIFLLQGICNNGMIGIYGAFFSELFDARIRYSGFVLSREISAALVGGTAPFVATALIGLTGGDPWPVALYLIAAGLIAMTATYFLPETAGSELLEDARRPVGQPPRTNELSAHEPDEPRIQQTDA